MVLEPETPAIIHQALEALPLPLLQHLATDPNPEVHVEHELIFPGLSSRLTTYYTMYICYL